MSDDVGTEMKTFPCLNRSRARSPVVFDFGTALGIKKPTSELKFE